MCAEDDDVVDGCEKRRRVCTASRPGMCTPSQQVEHSRQNATGAAASSGEARMNCDSCGGDDHLSNADLRCPFHGRARFQHADALGHGNVPHVCQIALDIWVDGVLRSSAQLSDGWYLRRSHVKLVVEGREFKIGAASGEGCNCLVYTIQQILGLRADVPCIRSLLEKKYEGTGTPIEKGAYLELDVWSDIVNLLFQNSQDSVLDVDQAHLWQIVCVDLDKVGSGDVQPREAIGAGGRKVMYTARVHGNHFIPLVPSELPSKEKRRGLEYGFYHFVVCPHSRNAPNFSLEVHGTLVQTDPTGYLYSHSFCRTLSCNVRGHVVRTLATSCWNVLNDCVRKRLCADTAALLPHADIQAGGSIECRVGLDTQVSTVLVARVRRVAIRGHTTPRTSPDTPGTFSLLRRPMCKGV